MKKFLIRSAVLGLILCLTIVGIHYYMHATLPEYSDAIGDYNYEEKIKGLYLLKESAKREDNVIIYGSSELRTTNISTHPTHFFANKRRGYQVNLIGRGSCQSIIHAMSIAASGDSLKGKKVVLITSPQSYVKEGIAPDLFMANYSEQQFLNIMMDSDVSESVKERIANRVNGLILDYDRQLGRKIEGYETSRLIAPLYLRDDLLDKTAYHFLKPYIWARKELLNMRDLNSSKVLLRENAKASRKIEPQKEIIDWRYEEEKAIESAIQLTTNNDYGMLNDYYNTYIGSKYGMQKNKDQQLSYSESIEYEDLRLLLDICKEKDIKPLFIHVPLHGSWSDYVGFEKERREDYYDKVKDIVLEYDVEFLDLTPYEYEEYFLCDTMHLGWKGWLKVNEAIDQYFYDSYQ